VDIEFISGDDSKLNAMISSGDMPDIVTLTEKNWTSSVESRFLGLFFKRFS